MKETIIAFLVISSLLSCSSNEPEQKTEACYLNLETTTGFSFFDASGTEITTWGNPNDYTVLESQFTAYPNPLIDEISIIINPNSKAVEFWVVAANCPDTCSLDDINALRDIEINEENLDDLASQSAFIDVIANSIALNLSTLPKGVYKLFVQFDDGQFQWQNIIIWDSATSIAETMQYLDNGCQ